MAQTTLWRRLGLSSSLLGNPFPFLASLSLSFPLECVLMLWGAYKGGSSHATLVVAKHDSRRGASRTVVGVVDVGRGSAVVSISQCKKKLVKKRKRKNIPHRRFDALRGFGG